MQDNGRCDKVARTAGSRKIMLPDPGTEFSVLLPDTLHQEQKVIGYVSVQAR